MRTCPDCHASVSDTANFCDNCGYPFKNAFEPQTPPAPSPAAIHSPVMKPDAPTAGAPSGICGACGYQNIPGEMFCQNCGVQLAPVASTPPPPPRPQSGPIPAAPFVPPAAGASASAPGAGRCPECGSATSPGDKFCLNCGVLLQKPAAQDAPPALSPAAPATPSVPEKLASAVTAPEWPEMLSQPPSPPATPSAVVPPSLPDSATPAADSTPGWSSPPEQKPAPAAPQPQMPLPPPAPRSPGMLVVRESGVEMPVTAGQTEWIIGRSDPARGVYPDVDMTPHGGDTHGVSRRHARLLMKDGQLHLEDLNSTNFTFLNRQRLQPGQPQLLKDGDDIRLGLLALEFRQT